MAVEFDPDKRARTLEARGLDMAHADEVFAGPTLELVDDRRDYGEPRFITLGRLEGRMVVMIWTPRGAARRIISLRRANDRERQIHGPRLR